MQQKFEFDFVKKILMSALFLHDFNFIYAGRLQRQL
jgi:hypothetical protein